MKKLIIMLVLAFGIVSSAHAAPLKSTTLRVGSSGSVVVSVQQKLVDLGYLSGFVDGKYGRLTAAAVARFQLANGMKNDGLVGVKTLAQILNNKVDVSNNPSQNTNPLKPIVAIDNDINWTRLCADGKPHLHVIDPQGGEIYKKGDSIKMTWKTCNMPNDAYVAGNLWVQKYDSFLELYPVNRVLASNEGVTQNDGQETFNVNERAYQVGSLITGKYAAVISIANSDDVLLARDKSEIFSFDIPDSRIPDPEPDFKNLCLDGKPHFWITSPGLGSIGMRGGTINLDWNRCNVSVDTKVEINIYSKKTGVFGFLAENGAINDGMRIMPISSDLPASDDYQYIVGIPVDGFNNSALSYFDTSQEFIIK